MRCKACNKNLSDFEATRKSATNGEFLDLCNRCFGEIQYDVDSIVREDLRDAESYEDEEEIDSEDIEENW